MKTLLTFFLCSVTAACFAMHIGYLMPSGGQQGRTVELIVGGQQFWGLKGAMVSGGGVTVESVEAVRGFPYPPWQQRQYLKKWLDGIEKGNNEKPPLPDILRIRNFSAGSPTFWRTAGSEYFPDKM